MEHTTIIDEERIKSLVKIGVLENNQVLFNAIEKSGDKVVKVINDKTDPLLGQLLSMAKTQGEHETKINQLESKIGNLWAKFSSIGAAIAVLTAFVTYWIAGK
jgi:hypothetical protein